MYESKYQVKYWISILGVSSIFTFVILLSQQTAASSLNSHRACDFLYGLINHPDSMGEFISDDDYSIANRLGMQYLEAPCKPLIAWGLPVDIVDNLRNIGVDGNFIIEKIDEIHSRLVLFPGDSIQSKEWIFRNNNVISSILFYINDWHTVETTHFRFFINDSTMFHLANIEALETYLSEQAQILGLTDADMERLSEEKIYYCFCKNQEEMKYLTGFSARGMYILSHDIIVSTYSAHFHELSHLLINYKLKRLHINTHPLFLEGYAVAFGGRGGKSPRVLNQLGVFLYQSELVTPDELFEVEKFNQMDASLSYPASAVYTKFLINRLGINNYLLLYSKYGGDWQSVSQMKIQKTDLPNDIEWKNYLIKQPNEGAITPGAEELRDNDGIVTFQQLTEHEYLGFVVPEITLASFDQTSVGYQSIVFGELVNDQSYAGEYILIKASSEEVMVYDLYTNTMIAYYSSSLSDTGISIPINDGRYIFRIERSVFPDNLDNVKCRYINK